MGGTFKKAVGDLVPRTPGRGPSVLRTRALHTSLLSLTSCLGLWPLAVSSWRAALRILWSQAKETFWLTWKREFIGKKWGTQGVGRNQESGLETTGIGSSEVLGSRK